jgi:hypothetical protein
VVRDLWIRLGRKVQVDQVKLVLSIDEIRSRTQVSFCRFLGVGLPAVGSQRSLFQAPMAAQKQQIAMAIALFANEIILVQQVPGSGSSNFIWQRANETGWAPGNLFVSP